MATLSLQGKSSAHIQSLHNHSIHASIQNNLRDAVFFLLQSSHLIRNERVPLIAQRGILATGADPGLVVVAPDPGCSGTLRGLTHSRLLMAVCITLGHQLTPHFLSLSESLY